VATLILKLFQLHLLIAVKAYGTLIHPHPEVGVGDEALDADDAGGTVAGVPGGWPVRPF